MNQHPRSFYSPTPPSGHAARTTSNHNNSNSNNQNENENEQKTYKRLSLRKRSESYNVNINSNNNNNNNKSKRKSLPILQFEQETKRSRKKKRRYSDFSEFKSSRIRLNSLETDRSVSPHNKRRRISDICDLFQTDKHSHYQLQAIANIFNEKQLITNEKNTKPRIREIINANDVIIAVTNEGIASAFNRRDLRHLCYLNNAEQTDEIVSLFYNKCDNSFIICSIPGGDKTDDEKLLQVRSVPLRHIQFGKINGIKRFESETISYPGFLEYDEGKDRALTYDHDSHIYKLWDLNDYSEIYSFRSDENHEIEDVKITHDMLIQIGPINLHRKKRKFTIRSLDKNKIVNCFEINAVEKERINEINEENEENEPVVDLYDFVEYHNGYLYVKYDENSLLDVYDCRDKEKAPKIVNQFEIPDAYLFLKRCNRLLYYKSLQFNRKLDAETEEKHQEENHKKCGHYGVLDLISQDDFQLKQHVKEADNRESVIFITQNQTKIIYYSKFINLKKDARREGIIQINSLEDGELFGWIMCDDKMMENKIALKPRWCLSPQINKERRNIFTHKNPLKRITAIYYNDIQNEIYTGNRAGEIHIWA